MLVTVSSKAKDYVVMSNFHLQDKRLSLRAVGLLSIVLSLPQGQNLTLDELADIAREKKNAIKSILLELQDCGYLQIVEVCQSENGVTDTFKTYKFLEFPYATETENKNAVEPTLVDIKQVMPQQNVSTTGEREERLQKGFEWFWGIYPRRDGKKDAQKAWKAIDPNHELIKKMKQSIKANLSSGKWKLDKPEYIPMPATWLRGERWNDESSNSSSSAQPENDEGFDENGIKWLPWT